MADDYATTLRHAEREGWATYQPTWIVLLAGALAALGVMMGPLPIHLLVSLIAMVGELISQGRLDFYSTLFPGIRAIVYYVMEVWPFILLGTVLGVPLAYLRQRRGFRHREITGHPYRYVSDEKARRKGVAESSGYRNRFRLPVYPHVFILYVGGPVILWLMANYVNPLIYPKLLYNAFAIWLAVGVAARFVWEWLQAWLLRLSAKWFGMPRRSLQAEYQLKGLVENDPALSYFSVWDVEVDLRDRHVKVVSNIHGAAPLRRLQELAAFIDGVDTVEVTDHENRPQLETARVIKARQ